MHCVSPSTSPKAVCRLQGAVPVSTLTAGVADTGAGVGPGFGVPVAAEPQWIENAAMTAREDTIGNRGESIRASVCSLRRDLAPNQSHFMNQARPQPCRERARFVRRYSKRVRSPSVRGPCANGGYSMADQG